MPLIAMINNEQKWIFPNDEWKTEKTDEPLKFFSIKRDFYVETVLIDQ